MSKRPLKSSRQRRLTRYEEVLECYQQGMPITQIAEHLHVSRGTIYKYVAAESFPERSPRSPSPGTGKLIAPYTTYLRERCAQGCQNAQQLSREIQTQGFAGNPRTVLRWLQAQGLFPRRYELRQFQDDWKQAEAKESAGSPNRRREGNKTGASSPRRFDLHRGIDRTACLRTSAFLSLS